MYWGQELLNDFNKYLKTKKMKFEEFFEDKPKTHDNFMEPFNFLDCLAKVLGGRIFHSSVAENHKLFQKTNEKSTIA